MRKSIGLYLSSAAAFIAVLFVFAGCKNDVGLGESVDTAAPSLSIDYPPEASVIMDRFVLAGTCSDDKAVSRVAVTVTNIESGTKLYETNAEISDKSWKVSLNEYDESNPDYVNGWKFPDGKYTVDVVAYDNAGHDSGKRSRQFEIDNTAPFFVVSNPGVVVGDSFSEVSAYGSSFAIEGTIVDNHSVSALNVTIYDEGGTLVSQENSADFFKESDVSTAGGTSVTIARYIDGDTSSQSYIRYGKLYGDLNEDSSNFGTTKKYYCTVELVDSAAVWQHPESGGSEAKGNSTKSVWLYDDIYSDLISVKAGKGISYAALQTVISGTAGETVTSDTGTSYSTAEIREKLSQYRRDTTVEMGGGTTDGADAERAADASGASVLSRKNALAFSLNPKANPTYTVVGLEYVFNGADGTANDSELLTSSSGAAITVSASAGLDGANVKPETMKVWIKEYESDSSPTKAAVSETVASLTARTAAAYRESTEFSGTTIQDIKENTGFVLLADNKDETGGSKSMYNMSVVLDKDIIQVVQDRYYIIVVTGYDSDGVHFSQDAVFGFKGVVAGTPPTVQITEPGSLSFVDSADSLVFTGTVASSETPLKSLAVTVGVTDETGASSESGTIKALATYNVGSKEWICGNGFSVGNGEWTFSPAESDDYKNKPFVQAAKNAGKELLYTITVRAESTSGQSAETNRSVHIDTVSPSVSITSVTKVLEGSEYYSDDEQSRGGNYVNGIVTFKGSIEETNLSSVSYEVLVAGERVGEPKELGSKPSFAFAVDTARLADKKELEVVVTAKDKVGNSGSYSSKSYMKETYSSDANMVIAKETDNPRVVFADEDVNRQTVDNIWENGTIRGNGYQAVMTFSDDDAVASATVTIYKVDDGGTETLLTESLPNDPDNQTKPISNPYTKSAANQFGTASLKVKYPLPTTGGLYKIVVSATDTKNDGKLTAPPAATTKTFPAFYVPVDAVYPTVGEVTLSTEKLNIGNKVSADALTITADITDDTGIKTVTLSENGTELPVGAGKLVTEIKNSGSAYTFTLDKTKLSTGQHTYTVTAEDKAGNKTSKASKNLAVDYDAPKIDVQGITPTVTEGSGASAVEYVNGKITVKAVVSDDAKFSTDAELGIRVRGSDGAEVKITETVTENGSSVEKDVTHEKLIIAADDGISLSEKVSATCQFTIDTTKLADNATYTVELTAVDAAGNAAVPAEQTFTVKQETDAPTVECTNADSTVSEWNIADGKNEFENIFKTDGVIQATIADDDGVDSVTVTFAPESGASVTNTFSAGGRTSYSLKCPIAKDDGTPLPEGAYTVTVKVTDTKKETDYATKEIYNSTSFKIAVDDGAPVFSDVKPENGRYYSASVPVTATVTDGSTVSVAAAFKGHEEGKSPTSAPNLNGTALTDIINLSNVVDNCTAGYSVEYTATDRWGQKATQTIRYYKDATAPTIKDSDSSVGGTKTSGAVGSAWFKDETLSFEIVYDEAGSGVETVYFWLDPDGTSVVQGDVNKATASSAATNKDGTATVKTSLGGFSATKSGVPHRVSVMAVDKAGNQSALAEYSVKIDATAPEFASLYYQYGTDGALVSASGTVVTNKTKDITIYGTVSDDASGVAAFSDIKIGTKSVTPSEIVYSTAEINDSNADTAEHFGEWLKAASFSEYGDFEKTAITAWKMTIPAGSLDTGALTVTPKDTAGNGSAQRCFAFMEDIDPPKVTITPLADADTSADGTQVNGTIIISGTASDNYALSRVKSVEWATSLTGEWTSFSLSSDGYSWKTEAIDTASVWSGSTTGSQTIYIRAVAEDTAGNESSYTYTKNADGTVTSAERTYKETDNDCIQIIVDQNSDRPRINFTNVTAKIENGNAVSGILKYGKDSALEGIVTDDDAGSSVVSDLILFSEALSDSDLTVTSGKFTKPESERESTFTPSSGSFTFKPNDKNDGSKTVYIYVLDNAGGVFKTGASISENLLGLPKVSVASTAMADPEINGATASTTAGEFKYVSDSTPPKVISDKAKADTFDSSDKTVATGERVSNSYIVGGTERKKAQFTFEATDENGILGALVKIQGARKGSVTESNNDGEPLYYNYAVGGTKSSDGKSVLFGSTSFALGDGTKANTYTYLDGFEQTEDSTSATITMKNTTEKCDFGGFESGTVEIVVTVYDKSELFGTGTFSFVVDNDGPTITSISPKSTETKTGSVSISGVSTDVYSTPSSIQWIIPTIAQRNVAPESITSWTGYISGSSSASTWVFDFNGKDNDSLEKYTIENAGQNYYNDWFDQKPADGIYTIPVWFKMKDLLGNESFRTDYMLKYDPDGDKPVSSFTYPTASDYDVGEGEVKLDHITLGGTIRITGSVEVPSQTCSPRQVYMQIGKYVDGKPVFAKDGIPYSENATSRYDVVGLSGESGVAKEVLGIDDWTKLTGNIPKNHDDWWGIRVDSVKGGSWSMNINANGQLNPPESTNVEDRKTNNIAIRTCAVNENGKLGAWSEPVVIFVDLNSPTYTAKLYRYTEKIESDPKDAPGIAAEKEYTPGMYIKGDSWYLECVITDESSVVVDSVKNGATDVQYFTRSIANSKPAKMHVYIPIDGKASSVSYTITARDNEAGASGVHYVYPNYEINVDNVAPSVTGLTNQAGADIDMSKITNSDYNVGIYGSVTDTGSGFSRLAYFFLRTADGKTTIELPIMGGTGDGSQITDSTWSFSDAKAFVGTVVDSGSVDSGLVDSGSIGMDKDTGLYGVGLTVSSSDTSSITLGSSNSDYTFIRAGGLVRLGGEFYRITKVDGSTVTVDAELSGLYSGADAFFPIASIVDNLTAENGTWKGSTLEIKNDDGDGVVEAIKKNGTTWKWESYVPTDLLEDGQIEIVCVAFDEAGNSASSTTKVFIANNTPRLSKVFLATDLNGDGTFSETELGTSDDGVNKGLKYYSALTGTSVNEIVTITQNGANVDVDENNYTGVTMRNDLALAFEFVGGYTTDASGVRTGKAHEGFGAGNGDIFYKWSVSKDSKLTAPEEKGKDETLLGPIGTSADFTAKVGETELSGLKGLKITKDSITDLGESAYKEGALNYIRITLWDSTKGTTPGRGDGEVSTVNAVQKYTSFGSQYTVLNVPVKMDLIDNVNPKVTFDPLTENSRVMDGGVALGHVEPRDSLPTNTFNGTGKDDDRDDKISGKVTFTGTVTDETRINSITLTVNKALGNIGESAATTVAEFANGVLSTIDGATNGNAWKFEITNPSADEQFSVQTGHTVEWKLTVDSQFVANVAASDVTFTLTANDGTNGNVTTTDEKYVKEKHDTNNPYRVDVVPYITGIVRDNADKTHRSRFGANPVVEGETITVFGYNFASGMTVSVNGKNVDGNKVANPTTNSFKMTVPENSGELMVKVGEIESLNNKNNNSNETNKEAVDTNDLSKDYTDNRHLYVWNLGNFFNGTDGGVELQHPVMTADEKGNLYASWVAQSNSNVMFSYGVNKATTPIFRCYDQPAIYTGISFDRKVGSGGASVAFIPEHQGSGGTFSSTAMASNFIVGGMGAIQIGAEDIGKEKFYGSNPQVVNVDGNPMLQLDGENSSSYYSLESYDMGRRLGSFENPKSARFGNYLHNIWYDNVNESLHYSVLDTRDVNKFIQASGAVNGWVVIDGGYTGRDRVHEFSTSVATTENAKTTSPYSNQIDSHERIHSSVNKEDIDTNGRDIGTGSAYKTVLFLRKKDAEEKKNAARIVSVSDDKKSLTVDVAPAMTGMGDTEFVPAAGNTIALLQNKSGDYKVTFETIKSVSNDNKTYEWENPVSHDIDTATIYGGNMNVVDGTATADFRNYTVSGQSSSAGLSADIDVTSDGLPVVAYYDAENSKLKVAVAKVQEPRLAENWMRYNTGKECSGEVSVRVDRTGKIHIMYKNTDGALCYVSGTVKEDKASFGEEEVIDMNGTLAYGSLSVKEVVENETVKEIVPCVTYLNVANTDNCIKYAQRNSDGWDYQIIPSLGVGHRAVAENTVSIEARKSGWGGSDTVLQNGGSFKTATPATVDAAIAFKSKRFETAYLKSE